MQAEGGGGDGSTKAGAAVLERPSRPGKRGPDAGSAGSKRRLVSLLVHELRSPLASIQSYAEILLRYPPETEVERREFLQVIEDETVRLDRLLHDVTELHNLESALESPEPPDGRQPPFAPLDLEDLVERAALAVGPLAAAKDVTLELRVEGSRRPVLGDPIRLVRAVQALLENAIKFSHRGSAVRATTRFASDASAGETAFLVEDAGIGVPETARERIFEPFFQAAVPPDPTSPRGSGLGLPIARRIAAAHGGEVTYEPLARGSRFALTLPR